MSTKRFETLKTLVLALDHASKMDPEFKTRTYKFDNRYEHLSEGGYNEVYVLESTRGTGWSARTTTWVLPTEVANILIDFFPRESKYGEFKGRKSLQAIFNILKKALPVEVGQILIEEETRLDIERRRQALSSRVNELTDVRAHLALNYELGLVFVRADHLAIIDEMIQDLKNQLSKIQ